MMISSKITKVIQLKHSKSGGYRTDNAFNIGLLSVYIYIESICLGLVNTLNKARFRRPVFTAREYGPCAREIGL